MCLSVMIFLRVAEMFQRRGGSGARRLALRPAWRALVEKGAEAFLRVGRNGEVAEIVDGAGDGVGVGAVGFAVEGGAAGGDGGGRFRRDDARSLHRFGQRVGGDAA